MGARERMKPRSFVRSFVAKSRREVADASRCAARRVASYPFFHFWRRVTPRRARAMAPSSRAFGWLVALTLALAHVARAPGGRGGVVDVASRTRNDDGAFVLYVELEFTNARAAEALVRAWRECADWCRTHERGLLHYEISQSNRDELKYSIFERYASERDYAETHKATEAYKTFRPKMQALQDAGELKVSGSSFFELGHGFVS